LDIEQYSEKLCSKAVTFEAWSDKALVGLVAVYLNDPATLAGYVTNVSVDPDFMRQGIATVLLNNSFEYAKSIGFKTLSLEVSSRNIATRQLYGKLGFKVTQVNGDIVSMELFFR
jgi:ribosomal-protein-alanine N-acetyltransferase